MAMMSWRETDIVNCVILCHITLCHSVAAFDLQHAIDSHQLASMSAVWHEHEKISQDESILAYKKYMESVVVYI